MQMEDRISALEDTKESLDYRIGYSEVLHRKVGPDADIHHYDRMLPFIVGSALIGGLMGIYIGYKF